MDRYWRIRGPFKLIQDASTVKSWKYYVGFVLKRETKEAIEKFKEIWDEMKNLIPEDYYLDYELLRVTLSHGVTCIIFDTSKQAVAFVDFVEEHFNDDDFAYSAAYHNGMHLFEST